MIPPHWLPPPYCDYSHLFHPLSPSHCWTSRRTEIQRPRVMNDDDFDSSVSHATDCAISRYIDLAYRCGAGVIYEWQAAQPDSDIPASEIDEILTALKEVSGEIKNDSFNYPFPKLALEVLRHSFNTSMLAWWHSVHDPLPGVGGVPKQVAVLGSPWQKDAIVMSTLQSILSDVDYPGWHCSTCPHDAWRYLFNSVDPSEHRDSAGTAGYQGDAEHLRSSLPARPAGNNGKQ